MTAYIKSLQQMIDQDEAKAHCPPASDLKTRFLDWFASVPEISRSRPYSMVEMERALDTQGRYLSPVLLNLGWKRHRKWSSKGQYLRYWVPPGYQEDAKACAVT